jgi:hypothetical protein
VLDTLELVKFVNNKLAKKVVEMERQAKLQENLTPAEADSNLVNTI